MRSFINNIIVPSLTYSATYFLYFCAFITGYIILVICLNAFWKFLVAGFAVVVALTTWEFYGLTAKLKDIMNRQSKTPSRPVTIDAIKV